MNDNPLLHHRQSIRLKGYDYSQAGAYFVTIVTHNRECIFGEVVDGEVRLFDTGKFAVDCWRVIPDHYSNVELGTFVVMPNHVHGIVIIVPGPIVGARHVGARHASPLLQNEPSQQPIGVIVGSYKSAVSKILRANHLGATQGSPLPIWQRNYYEHVIRNDAEYGRIDRYIESNPFNWLSDEENPVG